MGCLNYDFFDFLIGYDFVFSPNDKNCPNCNKL